jgi:2-isopropylmalate synthase
MNMFSQGVDPQLDFSNIDRVVEVCGRCTGLPLHPRHPYAGELVYTAFSGSHQDAISKGIKARGCDESLWEVPYLPTDPADVGRTYESIIRINSQSGKGGVAYIMEKERGMHLPKNMHAEFGAIVQRVSDIGGGEISGAMIWDAFRSEYLDARGMYELSSCDTGSGSNGGSACGSTIIATLMINGDRRKIKGKGNGPIDAFCNALHEHCGIAMKLSEYHEHALQHGSDATAVAYVEIENAEGERCWGAAADPNIEKASFMAILNGLNRLEEK